jgi:hypothetical protein
MGKECSTIEGEENAYRLLKGKPEEKRVVEGGGWIILG